jgi:hypothetical protein
MSGVQSLRVLVSYHLSKGPLPIPPSPVHLEGHLHQTLETRAGVVGAGLHLMNDGGEYLEGVLLLGEKWIASEEGESPVPGALVFVARRRRVFDLTADSDRSAESNRIRVPPGRGTTPLPAHRSGSLGILERVGIRSPGRVVA